MSFNWCHGPSCHEKTTLDRIRGSKGNKVLRTKRIGLTTWNQNNVWSHFCSQGCWNDFMNEHWSEFMALHPRTEALETPIDVVVETKFDYHDNPYKIKVIKEVDNSESVG